MAKESRATKKILICDDDTLFATSVATALQSPDYAVTVAADSERALRHLERYPTDILLLDIEIRTPTEGLDSLPRIKSNHPDLPILMLTGHSDHALVRRAMQNGAWDYISKEFEPEDLRHTIEMALEKSRLIRRSEQKNFEVATQQKRHALIGSSPQIARLRSLIERIRPSSANVLITGETGTGKEVVARQLRKRLSNGELEPFVAVDSSTIQGNTAESVLFGHQKGAFTGADQQKKGLFEEADGGAVYFDEIANMPLEIQSKLLRAVQEKEVMRLGSSTPISLEFRVICASNRDLEKMVAENLFKEDLFQRLNVLPIEIPPLRERSDDVSELLWHFLGLQGVCQEKTELEPAALAALKAYRWPGNVRELANTVSYVLTMCEVEGENRRIGIDALPPRVTRGASPESADAGHAATAASVGSGTYHDRMEVYERAMLGQELQIAQGNIAQTAQKLGMDRSNLHKKLKALGLI